MTLFCESPSDTLIFLTSMPSDRVEDMARNGIMAERIAKITSTAHFGQHICITEESVI